MGVGIRLTASSYVRTDYKLQKILVLAKIHYVIQLEMSYKALWLSPIRDVVFYTERL